MTADAEGRELWRAPTVVPELAYHDVPGAAEWLCRAFGFSERSTARISGKGFARAFLEIGDGLISLNTAGDRRGESPRSAETRTQSIKVYVDDVDAHFERAKTAGATIFSEPEDRFWGGRTYEAGDPEGHRWEFSQVDRELAAELWDLPPGAKLG
ncbi:MAG: VOC family protein [Dehalococcoidia bacterium]